MFRFYRCCLVFYRVRQALRSVIACIILGYNKTIRRVRLFAMSVLFYMPVRNLPTHLICVGILRHRVLVACRLQPASSTQLIERNAQYKCSIVCKLKVRLNLVDSHVRVAD